MKTLLQVSLLLLTIQPTNNAPCNIFPKVFGGSTANSYLYQIDVYGDYLAMGGVTWDSGLTGYTITGTITTSYVPYVAMM